MNQPVNETTYCETSLFPTYEALRLNNGSSVHIRSITSAVHPCSFLIKFLGRNTHPDSDMKYSFATIVHMSNYGQFMNALALK